MSWESNGIKGMGEAPRILNVVKTNGPYRLIIYGTARCLWEDRKKVNAMLRNRKHHVMCINDAAIHVMGHPINHVVSLHKEFPPAFRKIQMAARNLGQSQTHCNRKAEGIDFVWEVANAGGTSALFGCRIGIAMGYKKIVLCGCPMDNTGHYWEDPDTKGILACPAIAEVWKIAGKNELTGYVRAASGPITEYVGEITQEWIDDIVTDPPHYGEMRT